MATVTATAYLDMRYGFDFSVLYYADYYQYASTIFRANSYDGFSAEFRGSGFTYSYYGEPDGERVQLPATRNSQFSAVPWRVSTCRRTLSLALRAPIQLPMIWRSSGLLSPGTTC